MGGLGLLNPGGGGWGCGPPSDGGGGLVIFFHGVVLGSVSGWVGGWWWESTMGWILKWGTFLSGSNPPIQSGFEPEKKVPPGVTKRTNIHAAMHRRNGARQDVLHCERMAAVLFLFPLQGVTLPTVNLHGEPGFSHGLGVLAIMDFGQGCAPVTSQHLHTWGRTLAIASEAALMIPIAPLPSKVFLA